MPQKPKRTDAKALVIVTDSLAQVGGTERLTLIVAEELQRTGWQVNLVTAAYDANKSPWSKRIRQSGIPVHAPPRVLPWRWRLRERWLLRCIVKLCARTGSNLVWCSDNGAAPCWLLASSLANTLRVFVHDPSDAEPTNPLYLPQWFRVAHRAKGISTHTESQVARIRSWCPTHIPITAVGATCDPARQVSELKEGELRNRPIRFGHLGRVELNKHHMVALQAFREVMNMGYKAEYHIHGSGSKIVEYRSRVTDLGLSEAVTFHGAYAPEELDTIIASFDVGLSSSPSEGFGLVLLEYMSRGRPFISTANDGATQILTTSQAGWPAPNGDVDALAQCMARCLQEPRSIAKASSTARQAWETNYTPALFAKKLQVTLSA